MKFVDYLMFWKFGDNLIKKSKPEIKIFEVDEEAENKKKEEEKKGARNLNVMMFVGVFLGVFFSETILSFLQGREFIVEFNWISVVIALLITIFVMPGAYLYVLNSKYNIKSFLVKFGLFFQSGFFWELLVSQIPAFIYLLKWIFS